MAIKSLVILPGLTSGKRSSTFIAVESVSVVGDSVATGELSSRSWLMKYLFRNQLYRVSHRNDPKV